MATCLLAAALEAGSCGLSFITDGRFIILFLSVFRYATEELKKLNMRNIVKPTCTLHVGNIQVTFFHIDIH